MQQNALSKALESLIYEMLILASALLLRDKRYFFENYPNLLWGPPQIAHDVIRMKCRLLLDFFWSSNPQDITIRTFGGWDPGTAPLRRRELDEFRRRVNRWTAHLSEVRTREPEYTKAERAQMEQYGLELLDMAGVFVEQALARGVELTRWGRPFYENFRRLYDYLNGTPRVEEGKGRRPRRGIVLERLVIDGGGELRLG